MSAVRIRRAEAGDALIVGALRLQAARAEGAGPEDGFLDRFVAAWDPEQHPTWVAELDGAHAGVLLTQRVSDLPWPGQPLGETLRVATIFTATGGTDRRAAVRQALTDAMTTWARGQGLALTGAP